MILILIGKYYRIYAHTVRCIAVVELHYPSSATLLAGTGVHPEVASTIQCRWIMHVLHFSQCRRTKIVHTNTPTAIHVYTIDPMGSYVT